MRLKSVYLNIQVILETEGLNRIQNALRNKEDRLALAERSLQDAMKEAGVADPEQAVTVLRISHQSQLLFEKAANKTQDVKTGLGSPVIERPKMSPVKSILMFRGFMCTRTSVRIRPVRKFIRIKIIISFSPTCINLTVTFWSIQLKIPRR